MDATHDLDLQQYICEKPSQTPETFDWVGFQTYMKSIPSERQTNVIKMAHNWICDGYQKDLSAKEGEVHLCSADCRRMEAHQHYISYFALTMV